MARWSWILSVLIGCGGDDGSGGTAPGGFPRAWDDSDVDGDCALYSGEGWEAGDVECPTGGDRKFHRPAGSIAGAGGGASEALGAAQPRHGRVSRGNLGVWVVDYALVASARGAAEVNET